MTPEEQQEAVRLRFEECLTYREIAERFHLSIPVIFRNLNRFGATGRIKLKKNVTPTRKVYKEESERTAEERLELATMTLWPIERREAALKYAERYLLEPERQRLIEVVEVRGRQYDAMMEKRQKHKLDWNEENDKF